MSNLVDKEKLLMGLGSLAKQQHTDYGAEMVRQFISKVIEGAFDFKPTEPRSKSSPELHIDQIRRVCFGAVTGKACPNHIHCDFVKGLSERPCDSVLRPLIEQKFTLIGTKDSILLRGELK